MAQWIEQRNGETEWFAVQLPGDAASLLLLKKICHNTPNRIQEVRLNGNPIYRYRRTATYCISTAEVDKLFRLNMAQEIFI